MSRRKKAWLFGLLGVAGLLLIAFFTAVAVLQTDWFKDKVRARIVSEAESATGGRVEIGRFDYNWHSLTAEVAPFVIHGKEPPRAPPFFRADRIRVGLRIISLLEKQVDLVSLTVEKPQVSITVNPDGSTNVPGPKGSRASNKNFAEQILDLKVRHFELHDGFAEYNSQRIPLDVQGDRLQASVTYEAGGRRYMGEISSRQVLVSSPQLKAPLAFDLDTRVALERNQIQIVNASLETEGSKIALDGLVRDLFSPRAEFNLTASAPVKELNKAFGLPLESKGVVSFQGKGSVESAPFQYKLEGKLVARELALRPNTIPIRDITLLSRLEITPARISLPDLQLFALHGRFKGSAQIVDFKKFSVSGTAEDLSIQELARLSERDSGDLNGKLSGTVRLGGQFSPGGAAGIILDAKLDIAPGTGGVPVKGAIAINYDQRAGKLELGNSDVSIGSTMLAVSGTLGDRLDVHLTSGNFNDFLPLFALFGESAPKDLRVALHGGLARFDGVVAGPLTNPRSRGR